MRTRLVGAATVAVLAAGALATTNVIGSSHREAPRIMLDPSADNTDVYAFVAPDAPGKLTVVSNWIPLQNPAGGPYFGKLDPEARYYVKIDNTGDGVEDVAYRWEFNNRFRNPKSFLYAVPPVNSINDPNLNFVQTYDLYVRALPRRAHDFRAADREQRAGRARQRRPEDDAQLRGGGSRRDQEPAAAAASRSSARSTTRSSSTSARSSTASTSTSPAARRSGSATRAAAKTTSRASTSTRSSCRSRPSDVTRDGRDVKGPKAANAVVGVWSTTERLKIPVNRGNGKPRWQQVSRLGNPLINEVIIPIGQKDSYNATSPANDGKNFGAAALSPEPATILNALFKLGIKENNRTDIVQALLTGIPGLTQIAKQRRAGRHAEGQPRRAPVGHPEPLRRARQRHRRLPERPPSGRRRRRTSNCASSAARC